MNSSTGIGDAVPPAIIAQAKAAVAANSEDSRDAEQGSSSHEMAAGREQRLDRPPRRQQSSPAMASILNDHVSNDSEESPPPYDEQLYQLQFSQDGFNTRANLTEDGRIDITIDQKTRRLSELLLPTLRNQLSLAAEEAKHPLPPGYIPPALGGQPGQDPPPSMNIVIQVVGSRGDVQPFVALGRTLRSTYGHRVRLATHPTFRPFVEENGLEFFSIGGDPAELMEFMVKNPGLMPGNDSLKNGDVGKRRKGMEEIVQGCWRSCIEAGDGSGPPTRTSREEGSKSSADFININAGTTEQPFIADAIIANPPSFAHVHIAEKLGIPLHLMFTMPWSPTQSFPHPLANIQSSNADANMTNFLSYALVEMMTWQGLGDIINRFRERTLGLEPISLIWAPAVLTRLRVPFTYCWSPALIPKPKDWGQHIDVAGFYFLSLASSYTPEPELASFLADGSPPVYIGFGSIVIDDPDKMTKLIFKAVQAAGVRALVSKGWGGLGADELGVPDEIYMLGNVPHDWLFRHVSCVVHHGGAGTTAAGIALGRPTVVVPFFGDQPFWGNMTFQAGAGPEPIPYKQLTAENLAAAIVEALKPEILERATELGQKISVEKGTEVGAKSYHDHLGIDKLRCSLAPSRIAVWQVKDADIQLSALAATVLANEGLLDFADLRLYRSREYDTEGGPWDPISGGASALLGTIASLSMGVADFPVEFFKAFKSRNTSKSNTGSVSTGGSTVNSLTPASRSTSHVDLTSAKDPEIPTENYSKGQSASAFNAKEQSVRGKKGGRKSSETSRSIQSQSIPRESSPSSHSASFSRVQDLDADAFTLDTAIGAGKGISRIVGAGLKSPMDFTLGLARGFHNAPKLYGDNTVRPQEKVKDFSSGLKAAGREFGFGFYDGITGLVTQPVQGAAKEGATGLIKGIGKGLAGVVLKPGAAVWGVPGYTFMGIHKEIKKLFGTNVTNYIISARTAQGYENWRSSTREERVDIIARWNEKKFERRSKRKVHRIKAPEYRAVDTFDERTNIHEQRGSQQDKRTKQNPILSSSGPSASSESPLGSVEQFEQAIKASVASTSTGNAEEDMMIERAIRASVRELQSAEDEALTEQQAIDRAIQASVTEANKGGSPDSTDSDAIVFGAEHDISLRDVLRASMYDERVEGAGKKADGDYDFKLEDKAAGTKTEEEIVLEYVKKQSLAEAEHKKAVQGKQTMPSSSEEDADLRRAIEESLRLSGSR